MYIYIYIYKEKQITFFFKKVPDRQIKFKKY